MTTYRFPDFLRPAFDESSLARLPGALCVIDPTSRILWVNEAWRRFGRENGLGESVRWTHYLDGIAPPQRDHYRRVFADALASGEPCDQEYECASPAHGRTFHMRVLPIDHHGLVVEHTLVGDHRPSNTDALPIEERYRGEGGHIAQCSNCRRVRHPTSGGFHWVPIWVKTPHASTTHVICPTCASFYFKRHHAPLQ